MGYLFITLSQWLPRVCEIIIRTLLGSGKIFIVCGVDDDGSAKPIIKKLGWHTVSEIIQMETLSMVYKSINDLAPT